MNIQRFLLPAAIAATAHVALLWAIPREPWIPPVPVVKLRLPPPPPEKREETVVTQPDEKQATNVPVRPLAPRTPPGIEPPPPDQRGNAIPIPEVPRPREFDPGTTIISPVLVPGAGGLPGPGGWGATDFVGLDQLDRVPRATVQRSPDYPARLRQAGITGAVRVEFDVDTEGRVVRAEAIGGSERGFADAAVRAVLKWRFEPGKRRGSAVPFRMIIPVEFGLAAD